MRSLVFFVLLVLVASCGTKVPYTDQLKEEFDLSPENLMKVQFFTSSVIILEKSTSSSNQGTGDDGSLVVNSNKTADRVIINPGTKCIFEKLGDNNSIAIRFELGTGKILKFAARTTQTSGKYYLVTIPKENTSGVVDYGNETYTVAQGAGSAYLQVKLKKLQRVRRKDRTVKGLKV